MLTPKKNKRRKLVNKLSNNYRVTVLKEDSFEERYSGNLTPAKIIFIGTVGLFVLGVLFWFLYAHTPIKYSIPGYPHEQIVNADIQNKIKADSVDQISRLNDQYFVNLKAILNGEKIEDPTQISDTLLVDKKELNYTVSEIDSMARVLVNEEANIDITASNISNPKNFLEEVLLHKPVEGVLSDGIDLKKGHYGIDVSAAEGSRVKSIFNGTVVFSGFTASGGNEIHIQHDYNLLSIYKHNSAVLKNAGDKVISGESVAIVGNSGEHSDGTHLHFEMWQKGVPLNPEDYFSY